MMDWVYLGSVAGSALVALVGGFVWGFNKGLERAFDDAAAQRDRHVEDFRKMYEEAIAKCEAQTDAHREEYVAKADAIRADYVAKTEEHRQQLYEKHRQGIAELEETMRALRRWSDTRAAEQVIRMGESMLQHVPTHLHPKYRAAMQAWRDEYLKSDMEAPS